MNDPSVPPPTKPMTVSAAKASALPLVRAPQKEKFDQCIAMLKAYYDAIEARLAQNITGHVAAIGWLLASKDARASFKTDSVVLYVGLSVAVILLLAYAFNVWHYVRRWREIRQVVDALNYMEPRFYQRYDLPSYTAWIYMLPIAVLSGLLMFLMWFAAR